MKFQIYQAKDGWRWRAVAQNKKIVAESGEAYSTKGSCRRAIAAFLIAAATAAVTEAK